MTNSCEVSRTGARAPAAETRDHHLGRRSGALVLTPARRGAAMARPQRIYSVFAS